MRFEKGDICFAKGELELWSIALKSMHLTIYATGTKNKQMSFFSVYPNHTLVGGVSVNSLCQQVTLWDIVAMGI